MGEPAQAIEHYEKAIQIDDDISDVFYNLANAQYLENRIEDAIKNYKRSLHLNPKKVEAYYNLGNSYCNLNEYEEAIEYYVKAIALDPMHDPALYNLGYAYHRVGNLDQAIKSYKAGIQLNSKNPSPECHFNLASALSDNKQLDEALEQFKASLALDPENVACILRIASILESQYEKVADKKMLLPVYSHYRKAALIDEDNGKAAEGQAKFAKLLEANQISYEK